MDKRKFIVTFTIVEDERCVNLIGSRIAQHMQLITVRNDKIQSPSLEAAEHAPTADINVASNQMFRGVGLEQIFSEFKDVFEGLAILETSCSLKLIQMLGLFSSH